MVDNEQIEKLLQEFEPDFSKVAHWGPEVLPCLRNIIESDNAGLAARAVHLAGALRNVDVSTELTIASVHTNPSVRTAVAQVIDRGTRNHAGLLRSLLQDSDFTVRYRAAQTAGRLHVAELTPDLQRLRDSDAMEHVRKAASDAIAELDARSQG